MKTFHLIISGKVQGVFFRVTAKKKALHLDLTGWVKNTNDGNVEIIVSGLSAHLDQFIKWCNEGPDNANVKEVEVNEIAHQQFESFEELRKE